MITTRCDVTNVTNPPSITNLSPTIPVLVGDSSTSRHLSPSFSVTNRHQPSKEERIERVVVGKGSQNPVEVGAVGDSAENSLAITEFCQSPTGHGGWFRSGDRSVALGSQQPAIRFTASLAETAVARARLAASQQRANRLGPEVAP